MNKKDFYYKSSNGRTQIHAVQWLPKDEPKAIIQIAHGVTEHILRYEEFAKYFTEKGFVVVGNDHLGHGNSIEPDIEPMYFGPKGSWNWVVEDVKKCMKLTKEQFPNKQYYLLGFSLGSFIVRTYLINNPGTINGAILIGTGQTPNIQIAMAKYMANKEAKKVGEDHTSPVIIKLTFETYNKKFAPNRTKYDWLCSSNKNLDMYINDPLRGENMSAGLFREMLEGMAFTAKQKNINKMDKNLPILFLSGDKDPVGDMGKGVVNAYKRFKLAGIENVSMKLYPGLRHDILHEECKEQIFEEIYNWLIKNKRYLL